MFPLPSDYQIKLEYTSKDSVLKDYVTGPPMALHQIDPMGAGEFIFTLNKDSQDPKKAAVSKMLFK